MGATVVATDRGGDITYHGPGQLVGYPILTVPGKRGGGLADTAAYVEGIEQLLIDVLADLGLEAGRLERHTGVWLEPDGLRPRKIGAIGVRVNRWYASHGIALNADVDLKYFDMIVPCGLSATPNVTSLTREAGRRIGVDELAPLFTEAFSEALGVEVEEGDVDGLVREMRAAKAMEALRTQR